MKQKECEKCKKIKSIDRFSKKTGANYKNYIDKTMDICRECRFGIDYKHATNKQKLDRTISVFEKYVIKNGKYCWGWKGYVNKKTGYSYMSIESKKIGAHRVSWMIHKGEIPKGILVCHSCDNRNCSNPNHLFLGTYSDNYNDMVNKGKRVIARGINISKSGLTVEKITKIIHDLEKNIPSYVVSKMNNVSRSIVYHLKAGDRWTHLDIVKNNNIKKLNPRKIVLNEDLVRKFRKLHEEGWSAKNISKEYKIGKSAIWNAINFKTWKHVK